MGRCKPKKVMMLQILNWKFMISLAPQQRWHYYIVDGVYVASRDCVSIKFTAKEFDEYFEKVEKKGGGVDETD